MVHAAKLMFFSLLCAVCSRVVHKKCHLSVLTECTAAKLNAAEQKDVSQSGLILIPGFPPEDKK